MTCNDQSFEKGCLVTYQKWGEGMELHVIPGEQKSICRNCQGIGECKDRKPVVLAGVKPRAATGLDRPLGGESTLWRGSETSS